MAFIDTLALRTAIREVLQGESGSVRTVTSGRVDGRDYWIGADDSAARARTLVRPKFDIPTIPLEAHPNRFPENCSTRFYLASVTIESEYALPEAILSDEDRDAIRSVAEQDIDIFRQALGWPGNLTQTTGGDPTGLADGFLEWVRTDVVREDWREGVQRLVTRHLYRGHVKVDAATS